MPIGGGFSSHPPFSVGAGLGGGDQISLGSGDGGPAGVDARIEYNGLSMNQRSSYDAYLILGIDGLHDADIRDTRENNPGDDGETFGNALYGGRTVVLTGRIRCGTLNKLRDMQQVLRQAFADLSTERQLIFHMPDATKSQMLMCKKSSPLVMAEAQQSFYFIRDFQVTLRASNPRFLSLLPTLTNGAINATVTLNNKGNYTAQPQITLANAMTNPVINNDTTGEQLRLTGSIVNGSAITIDLAKRRVTNNLAQNRFDMVDIASDWLKLVPGNNLLTVTASAVGGTAGVTYNYSHSYI